MLYATITRSMEPKLPTSPPEMNNAENFIAPTNSPEQLGPFQVERRPEQAPGSPEGGERKTGAGAGDAGGPALPPPLSPPPSSAPPVADNTAEPTLVSQVDNNPVAADDVDVIEKEWVIRAKQIINKTRNDPYQQEHEVSKLQADYLRKRFGVEVKLPQE